MAIEKGLYQAPVGLDKNPDEDISELEIEIVNPESVTLDDGSMEITLIPEPKGKTSGDFDENIADILDETVLSNLADDILASVDSDTYSRKDWADTFVKGLPQVLLKLKY